MYDSLLWLSKLYNCLKTKMNDSKVSLKTQNRIRSYLVFMEYEKKFHTHEPVISKLSYQLQTSLNYELYSKYLRDSLISNMGLFRSDDLTQLVNKCQILTFQAQTDIYEVMASIKLLGNQQ